MRSRRFIVAASLLLACGCRDELHPRSHAPVEPPVLNPEVIADAPLSGTIRGVPFTLHDARYIIDRRPAYAHTDILLSSGTASSLCGPIDPASATSVWLRLEGTAPITTQNLRIEVGKESPWAVHYQVRAKDGWMGSADASAVLAMHAPAPDGHVAGSLSVCFSDDAKSCVSGAFSAVNCPITIDAPVRGAQPPEAIPEKFRRAFVGADGDAGAHEH